jgi:hypothetical protein
VVRNVPMVATATRNRRSTSVFSTDNSFTGCPLN